jgi:xylulokinase
VTTSPVSAVLGVDVGTSSTKGVLVSGDGTVLRSGVREHSVDHPRPSQFEMDPRIWTEEFVSLSRELVGDDVQVQAVGVSGMGPCVALVDDRDEPTRPAILYGVDMRAGAQIERLNAELGSAPILERCGSALTSQAAGPKIAWVKENEPDAYRRSVRLFMPSTWLVRMLTGEYVLDHHSASQCTPLYDTEALDWHAPWVSRICPELELPRLRWAGEAAGHVTPAAAERAGLPPGIPVITGTVDAWAEAVSAGAQHVGDLLLMYGTTMFLVNTVAERVSHPALWGTVGALPGTRNLAGGLATSGSITTWLRDLTGSGYAELSALAAESPAGARGLLMLPYFAGERTPIMDPQARGVLAGLTLAHTSGDLYRAALEATGFAVRHNVEAMTAAGGDIRRVVAVGGGTTGSLWTQIVSDITGLTQVIPTQTVGASYGGAFLAASLIAPVSIEDWNPPLELREPNPDNADRYDHLYRSYRDLYLSTADVAHDLAALQEQDSMHQPAPAQGAAS